MVTDSLQGQFKVGHRFHNGGRTGRNWLWFHGPLFLTRSRSKIRQQSGERKPYALPMKTRLTHTRLRVRPHPSLGLAAVPAQGAGVQARPAQAPHSHRLPNAAGGQCEVSRRPERGELAPRKGPLTKHNPEKKKETEISPMLFLERSVRRWTRWA